MSRVGAYVCHIVHGEDGQVVQQALEVLAAGGVPDAQGALAQRQAVPRAHGRVCQPPPDTAHGLANSKGTNNNGQTPLHSPLPTLLADVKC